MAGAVLAALPALAGGLLPWPGDGAETPFGVRVPGVTLPGAQVPGSQAPDQSPDGRDVAADPAPAEAADPGDRPARGGNDDHDRDDDSSGSGRSGGGGGGGSSGPG